MACKTGSDRSPIRVLVADDDAAVRDAYRQILSGSAAVQGQAALQNSRHRLFGARLPAGIDRKSTLDTFRPEMTYCERAEAAVFAVAQALAADQPFAVAFLDIRMPPGPDGVWAAARIRELDPAIEIVMCTAYSDIDPDDIVCSVAPEEKLSYVQKPFHPHEIRQLTLSLASKWRSERRVVELAYFDPLTRLPNREHCRSRMASAIGDAQSNGTGLAVIYLDLDNFKRINDTLGHAVGDEVLCLVASRLQCSLRSGDTVGADVESTAHSMEIARLSGDEYIVLLSCTGGAHHVGTVVERLLGHLREPLRVAQHSLVVAASIGISIYPADGLDFESLVHNAELAMYVAKRTKTGPYAFYSVSMNSAASRRFAIEEQLRGALQRGEFSLRYQPQFDVNSGTVAGMEALLRWRNPSLGDVPPLEFITVAEESDLILHIGDWVLREACAQAAAWHHEALPLVRMAINVSGCQFAMRTFPDAIAKILRDTGLDPSLLELEITESVVMKDETWAEQAMARMKALGVSLAIDDFGTGYSSFGRLRQLAVNRLKIDRSFVTDISDSSDDRAIVAAIIGMARAMRINVTAEGVETFAQLRFLQEHHCEEAQGYLFSAPLHAAAAHKLLCRASQTANETRTQRLLALID